MGWRNNEGGSEFKNECDTGEVEIRVEEVVSGGAQGDLTIPQLTRCRHFNKRPLRLFTLLQFFLLFFRSKE